jgi:hypothetical protein
MSSPLPAATEQGKPKLLDQVRQLMRVRHYSLRTEEAYVGWIRRYILFLDDAGKKSPGFSLMADASAIGRPNEN